jgi:hypothetical protein
MYLDPGTGSIVIQAILAAILAIGVFSKIFWNKIRSLFKKDKGNDSVSEDNN